MHITNSKELTVSSHICDHSSVITIVIVYAFSTWL